MFSDVLADQVHADAGADGGDVVGAQQLHHRLQRVQHVLLADDDLGVVAADEVGHLAGVLQVDGVDIHADGEGADLLAQGLGRDGAHQGAVQTAAEQEAHRRVCVQALLHALNQQLPQVAAGVVDAGHLELIHVGGVGVAGELAVGPVAAGREGEDGLAQAHQVLGLAGEGHAAVGKHSIVQRADADGIARGHEGLALRVVDDECKFRVQRLEHLQAVFPVQGQQDFAVGFALEAVLRLQALAHRAEAVELAVADHVAAVQLKGLHAARVQTHDGQPVEAQISALHLDHAGHVRPAGDRALEAGLHLLHGNRFALNAKDRTHKISTSEFFAARPLFQDECRRSVVPPDLLLSGLHQAPAVVTCRLHAAPTCTIALGLGSEGFFHQACARDSQRRPLSVATNYFDQARTCLLFFLIAFAFEIG